MQFANCDVSLGGDRNHVVHKVGVSPAEIEILRAIHGPDSVANITLTKTLKQMSSADLLDSLRQKYRGNVATPDGAPKSVVEQLFSGPRAKLPEYLKDIGVAIKPSAKEVGTAEPVAEPEPAEDDPLTD